VRIYASRRRQDRTWLVILASCLGVYLVFAVGFHWFLKPIIVKNSEAAASKPPPAMFPAYPDRRLAEPTNVGPSPRGMAQRSVARPPAELATAEPAEQAEQAERAVEARPPKPPSKPPRVAAPRSNTYGAAYPAYSGSRPF
jgi:hypothetical protein